MNISVILNQEMDMEMILMFTVILRMINLFIILIIASLISSGSIFCPNRTVHNVHFGGSTNNIINSSTFPSHSRADSENRMQNNETMMKYLAAKMSSVIDTKFINNNHKYQYIFKEDYYEYKTTYYK